MKIQKVIQFVKNVGITPLSYPKSLNDITDQDLERLEELAQRLEDIDLPPDPIPTFRTCTNLEPTITLQLPEIAVIPGITRRADAKERYTIEKSLSKAETLKRAWACEQFYRECLPKEAV